MKASAILFVAVSFASAQQLHEVDGIPYEVRHVQGNVYMFASTLGNVTIQVGKDAGHDGVLLVDTGCAATSRHDSRGDSQAFLRAGAFYHQHQ